MYANIVFPNDTVFVEILTGSGQNVGSGITYFINSGVGPQGNRGPAGEQGPVGPAGPSGNNGISPIVDMTENEAGLTFTVMDVNGTHVAHVYNGANGAQGIPGPPGSDYILTEQDKEEIAGMVYRMIEESNEQNNG